MKQEYEVDVEDDDGEETSKQEETEKVSAIGHFLCRYYVVTMSRCHPRHRALLMSLLCCYDE